MDLNGFLPAPLFGGDPPSGPAKRKRGNIYRPTLERNPLDLRIITWLASMVEGSHNRCPRSPYDILSHRQRLLLVRSPAALLSSSDSIAEVLDESSEWKDSYADSLFEVIRNYDAELAAARRKIEDEEAAEAAAKAAAKKHEADTLKAARAAERKRQADELKVAKAAKAVEKKRIADKLRAEKAAAKILAAEAKGEAQMEKRRRGEEAAAERQRVAALGRPTPRPTKRRKVSESAV